MFNPHGLGACVLNSSFCIIINFLMLSVKNSDYDINKLIVMRKLTKIGREDRISNIATVATFLRSCVTQASSCADEPATHYECRTIGHQDNWAPGQLGTGQLGTGQLGTTIIGHQDNWAPDNWAPNNVQLSWCLVVRCPVVRCPVVRCPIVRCPVVWCPVVRYPVVLVLSCPGAQLSWCPVVLVSWCPVVRCLVVLVPNCPVPSCA